MIRQARLFLRAFVPVWAILLAPLAASAGPGSGSATISPPGTVTAGANGTWDIVYTASEPMANGRVRVTIPAGWTTPQSTSSTSAGYVSVVTNEPGATPSLSIGGSEITVDIDVLSPGATITISYGDDTGGAGARAVAATVKGDYSFPCESHPGGGPITPLASSPSLTVAAAPAATLDPVPNDTTVVAGTFTTYRINVLDAFGNRAGVPENRTVGFFPTNGQFFTTSNHVTPITSIVIPNGQSFVLVDYRSTLATSGSPHTLTMFTTDGKSPILPGAEEVSVTPAARSLTVSTITATSPVIANGSASSQVVVTSKDAFGNPRAGDTVTLAVTGSAIKADPGQATNALGEATGAVTNTVAQVVTVSASINGQAITPTALVTFVAGPVSAATSLVDATTPVVANGTSTSTITVTARDANGNAISGQNVSLSVLPSANATLTQPGGVTGATGQVTGSLASTLTGSRTVKAVIGATAVTDSAIVVFNAGGVASFTWTLDGSAVAGVAELLTLTARDAQGNVITNYTGTVNLSTTSGGVGDAVVQWAAPDALGTLLNQTGDDATYQFALGDNGVAQLRVTDTRAESITLSAVAGAANGTSTAMVVAAAGADKVQIVSGNGQSATVNAAVASAPRVRVVDAFDNLVTGATVTFTAVGGGGSVDVVSGGGVDSTGVSGGDGTIDCDVWRMGTVAGLNRLRARIAAGSTPSVDFTATGTAGPGTSLVLAPGSKSVTVNSFETVTATLTDAFGNAKSGERVDVVIKNVGSNGTLVEDPLDPGTTTQLTPKARWGNTDANGRVTVRFNAPPGAGDVNTLDASTSTIAQSSVTDVTYTTTASGATNLRITLVDSSPTPAGQGFEFRIDAVDGGGNVDAGNTANVALTPEAGSGLVFSLSDDFGTTVANVTLVAGTRTVWGRGELSGDWDFSTSGGGLGSDTETMTITDTGSIDHYAVSTVGAVVAGATFNVTVEARDVYDNRVMGAGNSITLSAVDDANPNNPALANLLVTSANLSAGQAVVAETYQRAEAIRVKVTASGDEGISNIVTVSAGPAYRVAKVSGDATGVAAGANQPLVVQVLDEFDNPVGGQSVSFTVTQGGGSIPSPVVTLANGQATSTLTTGAVPADNKVRATILDGTPPSLERVEFSVQTVAGGIAYFTVIPAKTSLVAGEVVAVTVTAYDAGNNVVAEDDVTQIQLSESGNALLGATTGTLTNGVFATTVSNNTVEQFTITAEALGGGPPTGTSATITVGPAAAHHVVALSGSGSGITAGTPRPLQVEVQDVFNNQVPNALVTFSIASAPGAGSFTDTSGDPTDGIVVTNALGVGVVTYNTPLAAGTNTINATILDGSPLAQERVVFTVNTVASGATQLVFSFVGASTVAAGTSFSFKVEARDGSGNLDTANTSLVTLTPEASSALAFSLTNFGATTTSFNLVGGTRTLFGRTNKAGTWDITANATGLTGDTDAVTVTHTGVIASYVVTVPDSVDAGAPFNTTIQARDAFDNVVTSAGNNVTLTAVDDVTPAAAGSTLAVTQATLAAGNVVVNESYTLAERIRVRASDGTAQGFSNVIKIKPAQAYRIANIAGNGTVAAGASRQLTARVLDTYDNPVSGQLVSWSVVQGSGPITPPSGLTNSAGDIVVQFTTSTTAGSNVARATIKDGTPPALETADFTVNTTAGAIASYLVTPGKTSLVANEVTSITVQARDANGNNVTQDNSTQISLSKTGSAVLGATSGTLTAGVFVTTVRNPVAETFTVSVAQTSPAGPGVGTSPVIGVTAGPAYKLVYVSGNAPGAPLQVAQPLVARVLDSFDNPVSGAVVTFAITGGAGATLTDNVGDTTDGITTSAANGEATASLNTTSTAGTFTARATILDGTPLNLERVDFSVTTVAGGIAYYTVTMSGTTTVAGTPRTVTVQAFDSDDNPVNDSSTQVEFIGDPGTNLVFGASPITLSGGSASTSVNTTTAQQYRVRVRTVGQPAFTGLGPLVTVDPANPAGAITATASANPITANGLSTTHLTSSVIRDVHGNQVKAGLLVNLSTTSGTLVGGTQAAIAANGRIEFDLRSSATPGTATVTMTSVAPGTATGTTNITFAPPPTFAANEDPVPAIVTPGALVRFRTVITNTSTTDADLSPATTFSFTDGTRTYVANLTATRAVAAGDTATLVFNTVAVDPAFTPAAYQPVVTARGTDEYGASINVTAPLAAQSLLVTSIEITSIVPETPVVSRGQNIDIDVTIKNNGTQTAIINDVDLSFLPAGLFSAGVAPQLPLSLAPGASGTAEVPLTVQSGATVGDYTVDASVVGTVGGLAVFDNSVAPHAPGNLEVVEAADLEYVAGTLSPLQASRGRTYSFRMTLRNNGTGIASIDSSATRLRFSDGTRNYSAAPTQPIAIAGNSTQQIIFKTKAVPAAFTLGSYDVRLEVHGFENGIPFSQDVFTSPAGDLLNVVAPAALSAVSLLPDRVNQSSVVAFTAQVNNTGGATVVLNSSTTRLRFSGTQFDAALNAAGPVTLPPGITTLQFVATTVNPAIPAATYQPQLTVVGTENGLNFNTVLAYTEGVIVEEPSDITIQAVTPSQPTFTTDQTKPIKVRMVVANNGQANVTFTTASIRFTHAGNDRTGQFTITPPASFQGGAVLSGGEVDTLVFNVTDAAGPMTAGNMTLQGHVEVEDQNTQLPIEADADLGGSLSVQTPATIDVLAVTPSQPTATQNMTRTFQVRAAVRNAGQSAVSLQLVNPSSFLTFSPPAGWIASVRPALAGGGTLLSGGEVDTVIVDVTRTGSTSGPASVNATIAGIEGNSNRAFSQQSPQPGAVLVQTAGVISVTSVTPSRATITSGASVPWTLTVNVSNTGQSDVDLALGAAVNVTFQGAAPAPSFTVPASLVGGGTVLEGGSSDQIVISVASAGTYAVPGNKLLTVEFDGNELNSSTAKSGSGNGNVLVQTAPTVSYVSLVPGVVSKGASVGFSMVVTNPDPNGATLTLDRGLTRLSFGGGQFDVGLTQSSPVSIAGGQQVTLLFMNAVVGGGIPTGPQADASLDLRWVANGATTTTTLPLPSGDIVVQDAPDLSIVSVRTSRATVTRQQSNPWTVMMVVRNTGQAPVDLDLSPAATRLALNTLANGSNVTSEYTIVPPVALQSAGTTILAGGATDSLEYDVTLSGVTTGTILVGGFVVGTDLNSTDTVSDDTADGGAGSFVLQLPGDLRVVSITPGQPTATAGQTTKSYPVKMAVRNQGGAAVVVSLSQANTFLAFPNSTGWAFSAPTMPGGTTLTGGETDTVSFNITTTGGPAGVATLDGTVSGTESNTSLIRSDDTGDDGGSGSITLQTPAVLAIDAVTPSQSTITAATAFGWDVLVSLRNTGQSAARLTLPAGFTISIQDAVGGSTNFIEPIVLEQGGVTLAGGASGTLLASATNTGTFTGFGLKALNVSVGAVETNSNRAFSQPGAGTITVQKAPVLQIVSIDPSAVTSESTADFDVTVSNADPDAATAVLDRGSTRVRFASDLYSAFLQVGSPDSLRGGETVTLQFEAKEVVNTIALDSYDFRVDFGYNANEIDLSSFDVLVDGVTVQAAPQLSITSITASQPNVTAGQLADWTATMTVVNNGSADIDLDLSAVKTFLQFVAPGAQVDNTYLVAAPVMVSGDDILKPLEQGEILFTIQETGVLTGAISITGQVEGRDLAQFAIVTDNTFDGGRGTVNVQASASVSVLATRTTQPEVTVGQASDWAVRVVVANTGAASVDLNLVTAAISIAGPATGWAVDPAVLLGGGVTLEGGSVDSLLFNVRDTGTTSGTWSIGASVPWTETNTGATGTAVSSSPASFGSITVETRPALRITTTTVSAPNPAEVNTGQAFDVIVQVQNQGQADARDVVIGMITNGASTLTPVSPLAEVPGNTTVSFTRPAVASATPAPSELFTTSIESALDENSAQSNLVIVNTPQDSTATVAVQTPAVLDVEQVRASQASITQGQSNPWNVIVRVRNTGQADADLTTPDEDDVAFSIGGSTKIDYIVQPPTMFGSGAAGWRLAGGAVDSLIYSVLSTGSDTGTLDVGVGVDGTDRNQPALALSDAGTTSLNVQPVAGLAIISTVGVGTFNHATANRDTVNTNFAYEIHVTVQNRGEAVDSVRVNLGTDGSSVIAPASLKRESIAADASRNYVFRVTAPAALLPLETFSAAIAPGVVSQNSGQPVTAEPPVDNTHVVAVQRPASLVMGLTASAAAGVVSPSQVFVVTGRVTRSSVNQATVAGPAEITLTVPTGFSVQEPLVRAFTVNSPVNWTVTAPAAPQASDNFTSTITTIPNDVNIAAPAQVLTASDVVPITVSTGGALTLPSLLATAPAGAVDDTVSVGQTVSLTARVTATSTTDNVQAVLTLAPGFNITGGSLTRNLGNGTGAELSVTYNVIVPANPGGPADLYVTFTGIDENSQDPVPSAADTVEIVTVARAQLTASASVTAPVDAIDNSVAISTPFTVTANVANVTGAAGIGATGVLTIVLPAGYALAGGEVAAKPFAVATPVSWVVNAPAQPSGPDQIAVNISTVPLDENSGLAALVANGTATIAMETEGAAVAVRDVSENLGVNTAVVPAGATDVSVLAFEIAYNVTDTNLSPAEIDTIAITVLGKNGQPLGNGTLAATLKALSIDLGGSSSPYVVNEPSTNPVVVSFVGGGAERRVPPNDHRNAIVRVDLETAPRESEISLTLRSGALRVRDPGSNQAVGVTDGQGRPLDGQVRSRNLVVLSGTFEDYVHNYPNPFRAGGEDTRIAYFMNAAGSASIKIYAVTGELVYEESLSGVAEGPQETTWDGRNGKGEVVRNGIYICVINAGSNSARFRIAVAK